MVASEILLLKGSAMKIWTILVMIVAIAMIIAIPTLAGAVVGMLISFMFAIDVTPTALIGALGGFCASLAFLLNAGLNGKKGL